MADPVKGDVSSVISQRIRFGVPIRQPLVLITQIQRSGGTVLTQLLDGHTKLHVHPSELHIGKPKWIWPDIDLNRPPLELFTQLREKTASVHAASGYLKISPAEKRSNKNFNNMALPFIFIDSLQEQMFLKLMESAPPRTTRDVLDHYATSYFNAWLDYRGLYREVEAKYWLAFIARFLIDERSADRFFSDYPDGHLIIPVRDPVSWYASAYAHSEEYREVNLAIDLWLLCNRHALAAKARFPTRVVFVLFEDLIARPRATLRSLLGRIDLDFEPATMKPTFNQMPIMSDSSFGSKHGIDRSAIDRASHLPRETISTVRARTGEVYRCLKQHAIRPRHVLMSNVITLRRVVAKRLRRRKP